MAQVTPKSKGGSAPTAEPERQIYLGPNLPGLAHGAVFRGGLPLPVEELLTQRPGLRDCLRPLSGLVAAKLELSDPDSPLRRAYHRVARATAQGGEA